MIARRSNIDPEHAMLAEAATTWAATESIDRKLGEELIAAARDAVNEWHRLQINRRERSERFFRLRVAIEHLERLVGRP